MVSEKLTIVNKLGMHMRPASTFVQTMVKYQSSVAILFNGKSFDGKSIMQMMTSNIKGGAEVEVQCSGPDEAEALKAASDLIKAGLGDEI